MRFVRGEINRTGNKKVSVKNGLIRKITGNQSESWKLAQSTFQVKCSIFFVIFM